MPLSAAQVRALLAGDVSCYDAHSLTRAERFALSELLGWARRAPALLEPDAMGFGAGRRDLVQRMLRDMGRAAPATYAGKPPDEWWQTAGRMQWAAAVIDAGWRPPELPEQAPPQKKQ